MAIGKRIRFFRTLKNLTQKELGLNSDIGFMHTLFVLEDTRYLHITQTESGQYCIALDRYVENRDAFNMNRLFELWHNEYQKFLNREITKEEYDHWRYTYPRVEADRTQQRLKEMREKETEE